MNKPTDNRSNIKNQKKSPILPRTIGQIEYCPSCKKPTYQEWLEEPIGAVDIKITATCTVCGTVYEDVG